MVTMIANRLRVVVQDSIAATVATKLDAAIFTIKESSYSTIVEELFATKE